jgi:Zn ribbon nucleic-acid-binding protein
MTQIFHRSTNTLSRLSIFGAIFIIAAASTVVGVLIRSPYFTEAHVVREQPVPFSHKHHVSGIGIDCRYCHTSVEESSFAGVPPTKTCMNCHSQVWRDSPTLEPVRASFREDRSLKWTRVNNLPDFVYFDHSIHVHRGVQCTTCHGQVDQMPMTWRENTLFMEWCLQCHRHPEQYIKTTSKRPDSPNRLTNCSVCHR